MYPRNTWSSYGSPNTMETENLPQPNRRGQPQKCKAGCNGQIIEKQPNRCVSVQCSNTVYCEM